MKASILASALIFLAFAATACKSQPAPAAAGTTAVPAVTPAKP